MDKLSTAHSPSFLHEITVVFIITLSSVITFVATDGAGINAVIASALIGITGSFLPSIGSMKASTLHTHIYVGSFAGMCSGNLVTSLHEIISVGLMAGVVALITRNWFVGIGGKMGSIAFIGCLAVFWGEGGLWWLL